MISAYAEELLGNDDWHINVTCCMKFYIFHSEKI